MSVFEERVGLWREFTKSVGWDGHSAARLSDKVWDTALRVHEEYKLSNRDVELEPFTNGMLRLETTCVHGRMEIHIDDTEYLVTIGVSDTRPEYVCMTYPLGN